MHEHRGLSIAIAVASFGFFAIVAFVLVVLGWFALSVYAIVKMVGSGPDSANPFVVGLSTVLLVTMLVVALAVGIGLIGRPMTPKKRSDRDALERAAVELPD